jgi:phosphinothricin acetyltransferase
MNTPPLIRLAQESDFAAIASLTTHYILNSPAHFAYEPTTTQQQLDAWRRSKDRHPFFIAECPAPQSAGAHLTPTASPPLMPTREGFVLAGYAKTYPWRERSAYAWTAETGIYLHPAFHRAGIGTALYTALISEARQRGFHTLVAGITLPNPASIGLHEHLGFTRAATFERVGWKFDAWHDIGFWQLTLDDGTHVPEPLPPLIPPA